MFVEGRSEEDRVNIIRQQRRGPMLSICGMVLTKQEGCTPGAM